MCVCSPIRRYFHCVSKFFVERSFLSVSCPMSIDDYATLCLLSVVSVCSPRTLCIFLQQSVVHLFIFQHACLSPLCSIFSLPSTAVVTTLSSPLARIRLGRFHTPPPLDLFYSLYPPTLWVMLSFVRINNTHTHE